MGEVRGIIKVVHIIGGGEFGGAEQHVLQLVKRLSSYGISSQVVCLFGAPFYQILEDAGIPAQVVEMHGRCDLGAVFRLARLLRKIRPQVVHTHGVRANLVGRLAARVAGVPSVVTTVHSVLEHDYPSPFSRLVNSLTEKVTSSMTDRFIAVSGFIRDYLVAAGIPEQKVEVIYNGIDPGTWRQWEGDASFRESLGIAPDAPLIGIVARLHPVKGHRYFLEAAREVVREVPQARFLIVGSGFYWRQIDSMIAEFGLGEHCLRTGFQQEVGKVYAALDVLVISSLSEGFGLTALEALALGKPVIATRVGALPEILGDGECGILVPPADSGALARALLDLLQNPDLARRLAERGRKRVLGVFSIEKTVAATARLYRSLSNDDSSISSLLCPERCDSVQDKIYSCSSERILMSITSAFSSTVWVFR
ncbi:MAG: Glycosyl transferase [Thermoanaerobacterales bacterium 50_218]|nr:MAG: Glycosyl transferase [Thermoanaerobacterales bacterium 50_218]HAA89289.1 glycosyl transferase [Peptococcaceae bacterium]